ncbi:MAG: ParM/StbA family protein [Paraclostridium sp.]
MNMNEITIEETTIMDEQDVVLGYSDDEFAEMLKRSIKGMDLPETIGSVSVGIDIGNITTVAVSGKNKIVFESRLGEMTEYDILGKAKTIELLNETYVVEKGEFENREIKHEKDNYLHLLTYAVGNVVKRNNVLINLIVGIPASQFNTPAKDSLEKKLKANRTLVCKIDGKKRILQIGEIFIVPEGYGVKAIGGFKDCRKNAETIVVDIGGGTTDLAFFSPEGNFIKGETIDVGLLYLYEKTAENLKTLGLQKATKELGKRYYDGELDFLNASTGEIEKKYKADALITFLRRLVNQFRGKTENPEQANIILCGGGAKKVANNFKKIYPRTIVIEGVTVNAEGNDKVGSIKWAK